MPRYLPDRFQPDSIAGFRSAARQRFADAEALRRADRRSGAIYLYGYSAEMILKSAFFQCQGFSESQRIELRDLISALQRNASRPNLHHLGLWADVLVQFRISTPGFAYPDPTFGTLIRSKASAIYQIWRETIRYHKNLAYLHELNRIRNDVQWLYAHGRDL